MNSKPNKKVARFIDNALRLGSEMADVLVHIKGKPGPFAAAAVAAKAWKTYRDVSQIDYRLFYQGGWSAFRIPLTGQVLRMLRQALPENFEVSNNGDYKTVLGHISGLELGWIEYTNWTEGPYVKGAEEEIKLAIEALRAFLWDDLGTSLKFYQEGPSHVLGQDRLTQSMPSETAREITERIMTFTGFGHPRAVLLYGEPGTGKSFILREVGKAVGGRTLRIYAEDISDSNQIADVVAFLRPGTVLIDDFDRVLRPQKLLARFEELLAAASLLMVTVNDLAKLDRAMLRPDRFDDLICVDSLDEGVIAALLKDVPKRHRAHVRDLPVAYISHFAKLWEVLGEEQALSELEGLRERYALVKQMGEAEEAEEAEDEKIG